MELEGYFDHHATIKGRSDQDSAEAEAIRLNKKTEL
jgi:hypothetical protein